jgi:hypothetical protein
MDWTNAANLLQAIYWSSFVFLFALGYSHGNRLV